MKLSPLFASILALGLAGPVAAGAPGDAGPSPDVIQAVVDDASRRLGGPVAVAPGGPPVYPDPKGGAYPGSPYPGSGPSTTVGGVLGTGDGSILPPPELPPATVAIVPGPGPGAGSPPPPPPAGTMHTVVPGDTLWGIASRYCGSGPRWKEIYEANRDQIRNPHWIYPGQQFRIPCGDGKAPTYPDPKGPGPGPGPGPGDGTAGSPGQGKGDFTWIKRNPLPAGSYTITGRFGDDRGNRSHQGVDMATRPGARPQIGAIADGRVIASGWISGYGFAVYVQHPNGYVSRYAHMAHPGPAVRVGQQVQAGQLLGRVNNTGNSTGDHLHFEIRRGDQALNPQSCMHL